MMEKGPLLPKRAFPLTHKVALTAASNLTCVLECVGVPLWICVFVCVGVCLCGSVSLHMSMFSVTSLK